MEFSFLSRFFFYIDVEGAGRGAIAREDLQVGDIAMEIPASMIISEELLYESDMVILLLYKHLIDGRLAMQFF